MRAVVVSWNGAHLLPECLDSLHAQDVPDLDIVVVDNASTDGTDELLRLRYPQVRVVRTERNVGFAGGVVAGAADFDGDWLLLLNNDATLAPDAAGALLRTLTAPDATRVGAATAKILLAPASDQRETEPRLVNSTGNVVTTAGTGTDRDWLRPEGDESRDPDVFGFCGGAALLRASALAEVGGFDASLFLYYEDTDVSWRLRAAGWTVRYCADAVAVHRHASSSGTDSPVFRYFNTRNSLVVFARHAPLRVAASSFARQVAGLLRAAVREGAASPGTRARARALRDVVLRLPRTLHERRALWQHAVVPRRVVGRYLSRPEPLPD